MNKVFKKRFLAILLTACMVLILLPAIPAAAVLSDPDLAEWKEIRSPFEPNEGESCANILNNDYAASEIGWWFVGQTYYGFHDTPLWCMIKLDDDGLTIDGFKLYNGGDWYDWSWLYPINYNVMGWQIYSAGDEGDGLWDKIENYYGDMDAQWEEDWGFIQSNFTLLYDTDTDADVPEVSEAIYFLPSWPIPEGCGDIGAWDVDGYYDAAILSVEDYPNYEYFPNGPVKAKYVILAITGPAWEGAVNAFELFDSSGEAIRATGITVQESCELAINQKMRLIPEFIPENATYRAMTLTSSNPKVVEVLNNFGDIKGVGSGKAIITITANDGGYSAECEVNVEYVMPSWVSVWGDNDLAVNQTKQLTTFIFPINASNKAVTWSSSNEAVAVVDSSGRVTGIGEGRVTITATTVDGGKTSGHMIDVVFAAPESISFPQLNYTKYNKNLNYTVIPGAELSLWVEINPSYASDKSLIWSSSNESVAKIDASTGRLKAVGIGDAIITAKTFVGGLEATCTVSVVESKVDKTNFFGITPTDSFWISDKEWETYADMGMKSLRIHLQNGKNWADIAKVIKKANSLGIEVMMLVSYESYASNATLVDVGWGTILHYSYNDARKLIDVLETAVPYFSALGVKSWEIWNEQNGMWSIDVGDYAKLLSEIYAKFKYGDNPWDPEATVVFGGLDAVNGPWGIDGINEGSRQYVVDFYKSSAYKAFKELYGHSPFDAFGIHPYNTVTVDENCVLNYNDLESAIRGVALSVMQANGDGDIPIWITELGTQEPNNEKQAAELRAYMETAYAMPEVARFHYFKYVYYGENWGIVNGDGSPKPSLYEYKNVIKQFEKENPPEPPEKPKYIVNGVELAVKLVNGVAEIKISDKDMAAILKGKDVIFDLKDFDAVDIQVSAAVFKDIDKNITIITAKGTDSVKTKSLWNNSGKDRLIQVRKGKIDFKNI